MTENDPKVEKAIENEAILRNIEEINKKFGMSFTLEDFYLAREHVIALSQVSKGGRIRLDLVRAMVRAYRAAKGKPSPATFKKYINLEIARGCIY